MTHRFDVPRTILIGGGSRSQLPDIVRGFAARRVLLVTDAFLAGSGVVEQLAAPLASAGIATAVFSDVRPDPTVANVEAGLAVLLAHGAEAIVAVGGGSPIDAAKAIALRSANPAPLSAYMGLHKVPRPGLPVIALPTTAGTGSEATRVAVITDTDNDVKMMMLDAHLLPAAAVVDFELTLSSPAALTANVGVDTLTHGLEAYVSRQAHALTDPIALSCMELAAANLETAVRDPADRTARAAMAAAACQGGMAFSNSSVCLIHAMSRPLGAVFHLPHGLSNAALLPTVTRFSLQGATARYAEAARRMRLCAARDDAAAAAALPAALERLNGRLGIPRLDQCTNGDRAAFDAAIPKMVADALASGSAANNPVAATPDQVAALYRQAW